MNKYYIDQNGSFYYGDKPDNIETIEATEQQINEHILTSAKNSKTSDITSAYYKYTQNPFLTEEEINIAKTKSQKQITTINNAKTQKEIESIPHLNF